MFESVLITALIKGSIRPSVDSLTVKLTFRPFTFIHCAIRIRYFSSAFWDKNNSVYCPYVLSSIRVRNFGSLHRVLIELNCSLDFTFRWLFYDQSSCYRLRVFPKPLVIVQIVVMCQCTLPLCSSLNNLAFVDKTSLYKLNLSVVVWLEIEFSFIKVIFRWIQKPVPHRCILLPSSPVILLQMQMFHYFIGPKFILNIRVKYCIESSFRQDNDHLWVFILKKINLFWIWNWCRWSKYRHFVIDSTRCPFRN